MPPVNWIEVLDILDSEDEKKTEEDVAGGKGTKNRDFTRGFVSVKPWEQELR